MPKKPKYFSRSTRFATVLTPNERKKKGTPFGREVIRLEDIRKRHAFETLHKGRMIVGTGKGHAKGTEGVYLGRYQGKLRITSKGRNKAKYFWEMQATHKLKGNEFVKLRNPAKVKLTTLTQKGLRQVRKTDRAP